MNRNLKFLLTCCWLISACVQTSAMEAGAAKVDITRDEPGPAHDRLHARAVVLREGDQHLVIISVDAVAIGEIGPIGNDYLSTVRSAIEAEWKIPPQNVAVNASHCHGIVCTDVAERTIEAVRVAWSRLEPVRTGTGRGHENRIMENRRLIMKDGSTIDVRHAYSMPPDQDVQSVGPIDPDVGILRLDRLDGRPLAVLYNFACHPIQGVPGGGNTADMTGYSSKVIEETLGNDAVALFIQGCAGDINPRFYKDVDHPRDAEPFGNMLGLSTLKAWRQISPTEDHRLKVVQQQLELPRADTAERILALEAERDRLLRTLKGTTLSLKTFLPLIVKQKLNEDFPSYYSHAYLHEDAIGRSDLRHLDADNKRNLERYIQNIQTMEQLTRIQTNLALLQKHQAHYVRTGKRTLDVELLAFRIGDFVMTTFPGELTVQIGLNLKQASPHPSTFIAGYTNGYIYYAPTSEQLKNPGSAQEDCDCLLAPDWQPIYEQAALKLLRQL